MKRLLVVFTLFILTHVLSAQAGLYPEGQQLYDEFMLRKQVDGEIASYEGSPYLDASFNKAIITSSDGSVHKDMMLRYDIYHGVFEMKVKEGIYTMNSGKLASTIQLGEHIFKYTSYKFLSQEREGYLELILSDKYSLYKRHKSMFTKAKPEGAYQDAKPANYKTQNPDFFMAIDDALPLFLSKDKILFSAVEKHKKKLEEYIKENKLKLRREEDLLKAIEFLNTL